MLLAGCGGGGVDAPFLEYLQRLQRTLEVTPGARGVPAPVPRRPRSGELRIAIDSGSLGTLDFLDLRGCELQVTVGKQNSSLGKLARDSQRLLLALEFLRLAPPCIELLREQGDTQLAQSLGAAVALKQQQLPAMIFNATLGSEEFGALWRPAKLPADYPATTSSAVVTALERISASGQRWLEGDYRADNLAFELLLSDISRGDGGQLWRALAHQANWLQQADSLLQRRAAAGPLCSARVRPAAAEILPNVVRKFFVEGIQPRAARLGRRYHDLLPPVMALEASLEPVLPEAYRQWHRQRDSDMQALSLAPREHVAQLQQLLQSCEDTAAGAPLAAAR
ncbi:DUF3080 domain-containing protein [Pseudohalioglobus sediminis]|uniref:DUF3080 domain-containing protein n=2 Tax=Pseudohalioglobus sediminis TaxID=2606449 RepID=A0A5B0WTR3_9GAMM|nr:DUF3080 domain-containing protein [Pseudohalioglobus sediminis]